MKTLNIVLFIFVIVLSALTISLYAPFEDKTGPSNQIPLFSMEGLSHADLEEDFFLINVFTSWCSSCKAEKEHLFSIAEEFDLPVYGIVLQDEEDKILKVLEETGNPYTKIGYDDSGIFTTAIGTSGVPASIIGTRDMRILWRWLGPINDDVIRNEIEPLMKSLKGRP